MRLSPKTGVQFDSATYTAPLPSSDLARLELFRDIGWDGMNIWLHSLIGTESVEVKQSQMNHVAARAIEASGVRELVSDEDDDQIRVYRFAASTVDIPQLVFCGADDPDNDRYLSGMLTNFALEGQATDDDSIITDVGLFFTLLGGFEGLYAYGFSATDAQRSVEPLEVKVQLKNLLAFELDGTMPNPAIEHQTYTEPFVRGVHNVGW